VGSVRSGVGIFLFLVAEVKIASRMSRLTTESEREGTMSRLFSLAVRHIHGRPSLLLGVLASIGIGSTVLLSWTAPAFAQVTTADIVGIVTDTSGAAVPGVKLALRNVATGDERLSISDSTGNYIFTLLPVGHYSIRAEQSGFKTWNVSDVTLAAGDRLRLDVHLAVGQIDQSIDVSAQSAALQTDSSTVGTLVNEKGMQDLPLNGRNFVRLAQLSAGANEGEPAGMASGNGPDDRRQTSSIRMNGQSSYLNNFLIDGMDNNERFIGSVIVKPSIDALQEMKVESGLYSAEVGRTAGALINLITKSGGNIFHGSLFEYFRNEKLDAKNFFAGPGPTPAYKLNQYGGSLGGPIKKNRLFFFGDYEGYNLRQGKTSTSTVPTAAMRAGNFSGINAIFDPLSSTPSSSSPSGYVRTPFPGNQVPLYRMDQASLNIMNLYPLPQTNSAVNNFTASPEETQNSQKFDTRLDYTVGPQDLLYGRYSFNQTPTLYPSPLPEVNGIWPSAGTASTQTGYWVGSSQQREQSVGLGYVHTFSPHLLLDMKGGYNRSSTATLPLNYQVNADTQLGIPGSNVDADSSGLAAISIAGFNLLGDSGYVPLSEINNMYQVSAKITYIRGSHTIKIGADFIRRYLTAFQSTQSRGAFSFDSNFTNDPSGATAGSGNAFASFLIGYPSSTNRQKYLMPPGSPKYRWIEPDVFVQDDWRVNRWLTLNLGFRWDYFSPMVEANNLISNVNFTTGTIVIAGQNGTSSSAGVKPYYFRDLAPRFGFAASINSKTVLRGGFALSYVPVILGTPFSLRNPPFVSLYTVSTSTITPINRLSDGLPAAVATDPSNPTGTLTPVAFDLKTPYVEQFNLTLQRQLPLALVATASWVAALGRDQPIGMPVDQPLPGAGSLQPRRPYYSTFPNVSSITEYGDWGNSNYNALQTSLERRFQKGFSALVTYTWSHVLDNLAGTIGGSSSLRYSNNRAIEYGNSPYDIRQRFTLSLNYELPFSKNATGVAGVLAKGWQINAVSLLQTGLPFTVTNAASRSNTGGTDRPNVVCNGNISGGGTVSAWFNTACFAPQTLYTAGNLGFDTLRGPGVTTLDLSVFKHFSLTEKMKLEFRAESFNLTNTPNFSLPVSTFGTATFGTINSTGNNLPRNIQLALKLTF
jgi:hypothetical protein